MGSEDRVVVVGISSSLAAPSLYSYNYEYRLEKQCEHLEGMD